MSFYTSHRSSFLLGILVLTLFFSCSEDDSNITNENPSTASAETIIENEILDLVNAHRSVLGKRALALNNRSRELAKEHTYYMIDQGRISHDNFNARAAILFEEENASSVGENVAAGYASAQSVMTGWLNSSGHRENIEGDFTHIGISVVKSSSGTFYYTQLFLNK